MTKVNQGEKSPQISYFLFLKAKKMQMQGLVENTISNLLRAISIQEDIEQTIEVKSAQLGRYYYFLGTVYHGDRKLEDTLRCFKKAREILTPHGDFVELVTELDFHIRKLRTEMGIKD